MDGHATVEQNRRIRLIEEKRHAGSATCDELLELSLLALEPKHDGFRAAELLARVDAEYGDPRAKLWLAFTCIYELMDQTSLRTAVSACGVLISSASNVELLAAAWMLKAAARRHLSAAEDVRNDIEQSVRLAPAWIGNRQLLAEVLREGGDRRGAEEQLRQALTNVRQMPPTTSYEEYMFQLLITAQRSTGIADRLQRRLDELGSQNQRDG